MLASVCAVAAYAVFAVASARLAVVDLRERRLPNRWLAWATAAVAALLLAAAALGGEWSRLWWAFGAGAVYGVGFALLWCAAPRGLGGGDAKLAPLAGIAVGWIGPGAAFAWTPIGIALCGGIAGAWTLLRGRRELAYGPVILTGAWLGILAGVVAATGA